MPHNPYHPRISNVQIRPAIPMSGYDYSYGGGPVDLNRFAPTAQDFAGEPEVLTTDDFKYQPVLKEGEELDSRGKITTKDRPKGLGRLAAGVGDFLTFGITDWDKRGGLLGGQHTGTGYGAKPTEYELPNVYQQGPQNPYHQQNNPYHQQNNPYYRGGWGNPLPPSVYTDAQIDHLKRTTPHALAASQAWENQRLRNLNPQMAIQEYWLDRSAEKAAQRGMRIRAWKEGLPSNVQNIMASKQAQGATASSAWANELRAAAAAQNAANQFGAPSATIGRRFG